MDDAISSVEDKLKQQREIRNKKVIYLGYQCKQKA